MFSCTSNLHLCIFRRLHKRTNKPFILSELCQHFFLLRKYAFLRQVRFVSLQEKRYVSWRREE